MARSAFFVLFSFFFFSILFLTQAIYSTEELAEEFSETYWRWGVVSTVACIFLVAMSFRRLREISYGFFLVGHIIANIFYVSYFLLLTKVDYVRMGDITEVSNC